jgi:[methyl-Co(III) methanol-specific corrinoid protein]:coenzyme M methyltransferase
MVQEHLVIFQASGSRGYVKEGEIDPIPVFSGMGNVTVQGLEEHGWRFPEIHLDGYKMATAAASTPRLFGLECALVPFDMGVEAEVLDCEVNYYAHHTDILYPTISGKLAAKVEDVKRSVGEIIANGADAIWPGCDIWPTVPVENMEMLMAAAKKSGGGT